MHRSFVPVYHFQMVGIISSHLLQVNHLDLAPHQLLSPERFPSLLSVTRQLHVSRVDPPEGVDSPPLSFESHYLRHLATGLGLCYTKAYIGTPSIQERRHVPLNTAFRVTEESLMDTRDSVLRLAGVEHTKGR